MNQEQLGKSLRKFSILGKIEIVKYLIEQGADVRGNDDYDLIWVIERGHLDVVKYFVEQGADIHVHGEAPLKVAVYNGHLDIVKYLVEQGADVPKISSWLSTLARRSARKEILDYLESLRQTNKQGENK